MITLGCTLGGAVLGLAVGAYIGFQEGGDFNFAPVMYGPIGGMIGAIGGVILGTVIS